MTVISILQQLTLQGAADFQGYALTVGEKKIAPHAASCQAVSVAFVPLVVEYLGVQSKGASY